MKLKNVPCPTELLFQNIGYSWKSRKCIHFNNTSKFQPVSVILMFYMETELHPATTETPSLLYPILTKLLFINRSVFIVFFLPHSPYSIFSLCPTPSGKLETVLGNDAIWWWVHGPCRISPLKVPFSMLPLFQFYLPQ